jgi:hypothetical protein
MFKAKLLEFALLQHSFVPAEKIAAPTSQGPVCAAALRRNLYCLPQETRTVMQGWGLIDLHMVPQPPEVISCIHSWLRMSYYLKPKNPNPKTLNSKNLWLGMESRWEDGRLHTASQGCSHDGRCTRGRGNGYDSGAHRRVLHSL